MGACLCKTRRRTESNNAASVHRLRVDRDFFSDTSSSPHSSTSATSSSSSSSSGSSSSSTFSPLADLAAQQRLRARGILEALSLSGSYSDLSHFVAHHCGKHSNESSRRITPNSNNNRHRNELSSANDQYSDNNNNNNNSSHSPNSRLWSLQNKLALHADRLVTDTLESIRPTVLNEPSNTMQKLHLISETEIGWLVVVSSLINKVDLEHPFGSALILLILEDAVVVMGNHHYAALQIAQVESSQVTCC